MRVIVRGHMPLSVSVKLKVDVSSPQLSEAEPPPLMKSVSVENAGGTSPKQSSLMSAGQLMAGGVISLMMIVWTH